MILGLTAVLSTSCDASGGDSALPLLTVTELEPRIDALDGHEVRVAGFLGRCGGYDCMLYRSREESEVWDRVIEAAHQKKKVSIPDFPTLGIGSGENFEFDAKAAPFVGSYVVISGTVTNECRHNGLPACTDRGPDLKPANISRWKGEGPPTAQRGASPS